MSCAIRSVRASSASAALKKIAARLGPGVRDHSGYAAAAASTAAPASSAPEAGYSPTTSAGRHGLCFS